jgi:hypothetical protein
LDLYITKYQDTNTSSQEWIGFVISSSSTSTKEDIPFFSRRIHHL